MIPGIRFDFRGNAGDKPGFLRISVFDTMHPFPEILTGLVFVAEHREFTVKHESVLYRIRMKPFEKNHIALFAIGDEPQTETHLFPVHFLWHGDRKICFGGNSQTFILKSKRVFIRKAFKLSGRISNSLFCRSF